MVLELPEFKRCCCCLPLRYGLLGWGYIKLIFSSFLLIYLLLDLIECIIFISRRRILFSLPELFLLVAMVTMLIVDVSMTIVFLIGGHKKTVKLLRMFYLYSIVTLCLIAILSCILLANDLYFMIAYLELSFDTYAKILSVFSILGIDAYFILLIRSEIKKLRNDCNFRFTNVENEAQCSMEKGKIESVNETGDFNNGTHGTNIGTGQQNNGIYDENNGIKDHVDVDEAKRHDNKNYN